MKIEIGQLWWDKDRKWTASDIDFCYVVLSGDNPYPGQTSDKAKSLWTWRLQEFQWHGDGFFGTSQVKEFGEDEVRLMTYVGSIMDIFQKAKGMS